jgi:hypothetical protein
MPAIPPQLPASSPQRQSMEPLWPVLEQTAAPVGRNTAATHPVSASLGNTAQGVLAGGRTNHSLEHVRQGLLTMHTIRASMPTSLQVILLPKHASQLFLILADMVRRQDPT